MLECKVCGTKFNAIVEKHYVARDNGKTGFAVALGSNEVDARLLLKNASAVIFPIHPMRRIKIMTRAETLDKAKACVCGQRENEYGSPEDNFTAIAGFWSVYKGVEFTANDVAMMMALLKIARIRTGTATDDSYVDLAGYAACGAEINSNK